jgi:hypothetical protein
MSTMTQTHSHGRAARYRIPAARPRLVTGRFAAALLAFALTGLLVLAALLPAVRDRAAG